MKILVLLAAMVLPIIGFSTNQAETAAFKVYGACGMCEARIEKAAASIEGVSSADWNQETQILSLAYDPAKANLDLVHQKIADAGHDTEKLSAKDEVYASLPACCHYERKEKTAHSHGGGSCCSH